MGGAWFGVFKKIVLEPKTESLETGTKSSLVLSLLTTEIEVGFFSKCL